MQAFWQQVISGISTGGIYASLALALVVVYRVSGQINFAQGEMATFSTFVAWALLNAGVPLWAVVVLTLLASFAMGVGIERLLIRSFNQRGPLVTFTVVLGMLMFFNGITGWVWDASTREFPSLFPANLVPLNPYISSQQAGTLGTTLVLLAVLYAFFNHTRAGLAMRAAALNPTSSWLVGVPVHRLYGMGWGVAAALGALAGILIAPVVYLDPNMMMGVLIYAFAGAKLGGIENPAGAVVGGFAIGIAENLLGAYVVGTQLKLTAAVGLIVLIMLFFPNGLFARRVIKRV